MGFIEKIKSSVEMWRIDKYTKRRPVTSPDFEQKGTSDPPQCLYLSKTDIFTHFCRPRILPSVLQRWRVFTSTTRWRPYKSKWWCH